MRQKISRKRLRYGLRKLMPMQRQGRRGGRAGVGDLLHYLDV